MDEEAEIVALNAKINILKQKGPKKQEGKPIKMIRDHQCQMTKKKENKQDKKKADFHWQTPFPNQKKQTVDGKEYYFDALTTKTR